jgi:hypothetical protein
MSIISTKSIMPPPRGSNKDLHRRERPWVRSKELKLLLSRQLSKANFLKGQRKKCPIQVLVPNPQTVRLRLLSLKLLLDPNHKIIVKVLKGLMLT